MVIGDPTLPDLIQIVKRLSAELDRRESTHRRIDPYYEGKCPLPLAVRQARLTQAYTYLMPMAEAVWGSLVVDSVLDRLEPTGISSGDSEADKRLWEEAWQTNSLDSGSSLAHTSALIDGRAFAWIWPDGDGGVEITLDTSSQMIAEYAPGFVGRRRTAAMRRWVEDGVPYAKLFRADGIYKFRGPKDYGWQDGIVWEAVPEEDMPNPFGVVPVVELAVNRRLKPEAGLCGFARGEYEHTTGMIDRINLLTFLGLVVAIWMGFPLRGVIGAEILRDDNGSPIAPFRAGADSVFQIEEAEARTVQYDAADRKGLSIYPELDQLAVITKTPRHYFPMEGGMSNLSADAIRASEGGLHAKVNGKHKPQLGEGWEEVLRVAGLMLENPIELSQSASLSWADRESRSLSERADAYAKLTDLPWTARAEVALNASSEQITRWASERANDPLAVLANAAMLPPPEPPVG